MIYIHLRPTPSHARQLHLVCRFHPRFVPLVNILLYILTIASLLVALFPPMSGARCRCVRVFDVEAARVTHIPIVVLFYNVRDRIELSRPRCQSTHCHRSSAISCWDLRCGRMCNVICEWRSCATSSSTAPSDISAPSTALPRGLITVLSQLRRNSHLRNRWYSIICRGCGVLSRRCSYRQCHV